jgi:hypothetical protein
MRAEELAHSERLRLGLARAPQVAVSGGSMTFVQRAGACTICAALFALSCTKGAPPASMLDAGAAEASSSARATEAPPTVGQGAADAGPVDAVPPAAVDDLQDRAKKLFEAIQKDEPELAMALFIPRETYVANKDVKDPGAAWDKLQKQYKLAIHAHHKKLGKKAAEAEFEGLELNPKTQIYVAPKKEANKVGYNKVTKSKLKYKVAGKSKTLEIGVMIDNESKWYVTLLK